MSSQSVGSTSSSGSSTASAQSQVSNNMKLTEQNFLQLLTTQLANQDPSQPVDETQMLAQLAQFSTVEGINSVSTGQSQLAAAGLLGHTVSALSTVNNQSQIVTGKVTSVSWNGSNVTLNLDSGSAVSMAQVTQVSQ